MKHPTLFFVAVACIVGSGWAMRLDIHEAFEELLTSAPDGMSRSDITMQLISRSDDGPLETSAIKLMRMDDPNTFTPISSFKDEKDGDVTVRYEQDYEGVPVIGDEVVLTYHNGDLKNAYGTTEMLAKATEGEPCMGVTMTKESAIKLAQEADADKNGKGHSYFDVKSRMAIYQAPTSDARIFKAKCVFEVRFFCPDVPSKMHILVNAKTKAIELMENHLRSIPGTPSVNNHAINDESDREVIETRDELEHHESDRAGEASATGPGGNKKVGRHVYGKDFSPLKVTKRGNRCYTENSRVTVYDCNKGDCTDKEVYSFRCPNNNGIAINGAYSPLNDALYYGEVSYKMFKDWTNTIISNNIKMNVHYKTKFENAFFNGQELFFGDCDRTFYPFASSLDVVAHELGHFFVQETSNLVYADMSGGLNEALADMSAKAAQVYMTGKNDWDLGADAFKKQGEALRYMSDPPKDGASIDHVSKYHAGMDVHHSSGVFNKAFYKLATTSGWDVKKAFLVMTTASQKYWSANTNWDNAGNGALDAACDLGYNTNDVKSALASVGVNSKLTGNSCGSGNGGGGGCKDVHEQECPDYAKQGDCTTGEYVDWMKKYCKKTCGLCKDPSCKDDASVGAEQCMAYALDGDCSNKYAAWMKKNCKSTCGHC